MQGPELQGLIQLLAKLPGLGPRSGRRAALYLIKHRETLMRSLIGALQEVADSLKACQICGNLDTQDPCVLCEDVKRDRTILCVVESVSDLWALERTSSYRGQYHILGGALSALHGVTPHDLALGPLLKRVEAGEIREVILALNATSEGITTSHYLIDLLGNYPVTVSGIAHGVPVGGELDYLDEGTLLAALNARRPYL